MRRCIEDVPLPLRAESQESSINGAVVERKMWLV